MFTLVQSLVRQLRRSDAQTATNPATVLMESAGSRAGTDAHDAQELRAAAAAWLRVIR